MLRRFLHFELGFLISVASFTAFGQANVLTQHNDNSRTGANTNETILTTANVNQGQFGKVFTESVDGQVYAQPLYVSALSIAGGTHNVVYVCTEHNSVYAFDANTGGAPLWQVNLGPSVTDQNCGNVSPEIGITGTPVIDLSTFTLYVDAKTEVGANHFHNLHALDLTTGAEKFGAPVNISATVSGVTFDPYLQAQRPGLLLLNGVVYLGYASHCDHGAYHGWLLGYRAGPSTITQVAAFCTTPTGTEGGLWACGMGPAADANGYIYVETGNGTWDGVSNFGDSFLKLSTVGGLSLADWFTPWNQACLDASDADLGSGGPVLVPPHYVVGLGKEGKMYLCDQNNMGHFNSTTDCTMSNSGTDSCLQSFVAMNRTNTVGTSPVYWNGPAKQYLFIAAGFNTAKSYQFTGTSINTTPLGQSSFGSAVFSGGASLSSNGTANGILWTTGSDSVLRAYDAVNFPTELWDSSQNPGRDALGTYVKFAPPMIANGMVYVGTYNQLVVYGVANSNSLTVSPGNGFDNIPMSSSQAGTFTATVDDSPSLSPINAVIALSKGAQTAYPGLSCIARFNTSGDIDAYNGTAYQAASVIPYAKGLTYHFRMVVNVPANTYSVYVTPPGGSELTVGLNYKFRAAVTSLDTWTIDVNSSPGGSVTLSNLAVSGTQTVAAPTFNPLAGTYTSAQTVAITSATSGATIVYTTDGTAPTESGGTVTHGTVLPIGGSVTISVTTTLKAMAFKSGMTDSPLTTGLYTISTPQVAAPTFTPPAGTYTSAQTVTSTSTTSGASIAYTMDGSTPTEVGGTITHGTALANGGAVTINATTTLKAMAFESGMTDSTITTGNYTITLPPAAPVFSPGAGTYTSVPMVTITSSGATSIYYTTNGSTPTSSSTHYTGSILISTSLTLEAIGTNSAGTSPVTTGQYTINPPPQVAPPVFSPGAGTYTSTQTVTITSATSGASIRYTTDGSTPSETAGTLYSAPVSISTTTPLKAMAFESGMTDSTLTSGSYTIGTPQVAAPTFNPPAGTYTSAQTVTITSTTSGASIAYTTDGSTPTESGGMISHGTALANGGAVTISVTTTLKALAFKTGMTDSTVTSGSYTISAVTRSLTGSSGNGFHSLALTSAQTGTFTATFDATPTVSPENVVVGLSKGVATGYPGISCIARFNTSGQIDAYNGTAYGTSTISYAKNIAYHFRMVVNVPAHTYSVYVTPAGGTELTVGLNYAFRSTAVVSSLDTWNLDVNATPSGCSLTANNLNP